MFWTYSVAKKVDGFLLYLKPFPGETGLWVTLGDFTVKNAKLEREIFIQLKINEAQTKCGVWKIITVTCVTYVQKDF